MTTRPRAVDLAEAVVDKLLDHPGVSASDLARTLAVPADVLDAVLRLLEWAGRQETRQQPSDQQDAEQSRSEQHGGTGHVDGHRHGLDTTRHPSACITTNPRSRDQRVTRSHSRTGRMHTRGGT